MVRMKAFVSMETKPIQVPYDLCMEVIARAALLRIVVCFRKIAKQPVNNHIHLAIVIS